MLGKNIKVGDVVHYHAPRFTQPVAAVVTKLDFDPRSDDTRHVSLTAFPPGAAPIFLNSIQHALFWNKASHDLDGYWDWPASASDHQV